MATRSRLIHENASHYHTSPDNGVPIRRPCLLALLIGLFTPLTASALHPLLTDDAGTVGAAFFELELSSQLERAWADGTTLAHGLAAHLGVRDRVDVGAAFRLETDTHRWRSRLRTPVIDLKLSLTPQADWRPAVGVHLDAELPATGWDAAAFGGCLLASWQAGPLAFHLNAGVHRRALLTDDSDWRFITAGRTEVAVTDALLAGAEAFVEQTGRARGTTLLGGLVWRAGANVALSIGAGPTFDQGDVAWIATIGLTTMLGGACVSDRHTAHLGVRDLPNAFDERLARRELLRLLPAQPDAPMQLLGGEL